MKGYKTNIEKDTRENMNFRKVAYTGEHLQLVMMSLEAGEDIGEETHKDTDQFFRIEKGNGKCIIDGHTYTVTDGDVIIVPAGAKHNVINTDENAELKLYTLYAPPHHKDGIIRRTKEEAENSKESFDWHTTEERQKVHLL